MSGARPLEVYRSFDAREWSPPRPLEFLLETLESLPHGMKVVMLVAHEPRPLFRILTANGFHYRCRFLAAGCFEVAVWHAADTSNASAGLE